MQVHGWGRYPRMSAEVSQPLSLSQCGPALAAGGAVIARGLGRSYGDSSLAPRVLSTRHLDHLQAFDPATGLLTCEAGTTLDEILRMFVPRGWFPAVTPGTRFVTVGGAIAADVHGKNHHLDGTFTAQVRRIELLLGNGERVGASPTDKPDLFHATCGGMGLTGVILSATLQLRRVASSDVIETTIKSPNLDAVLEAFDAHAASTYSVAWIDCMARGAHLGRSLLMLGEHAAQGPLAVRETPQKSVPLDMPARLLNRFTAKTFNALYYGRVRGEQSTRRRAFEPFFYPLDALANWNRLYGASGLVQYQFVLPTAAAASGLREVLERIALSGQGAFLCVLKKFGPANANLLSFPIEGYTLAMDFRADRQVFALLDALDRIVLQYGGRLYLAKDARMSETTFKNSYPHWQQFEEVRSRWHAHGHFASAQSRRLGLS